ncbi:MAG TPA: allantoinase AllB [Pseudogracilibacillus sp.]|nr:allantoinase AllB [Pseudogracilibacillus sp.]
MKWDHIIENGNIVLDDTIEQGNIYIKDGKIEAISSEKLSTNANEITDAKGKYVLPGLIDTHIHSRDGGATHKEDFSYSTSAAAIGGITTVFEMPNTNPSVNTRENFLKQKANLESKANIDFSLWGISLGDLNKENIQELHDSGVIGIKYFWGYAVNKDDFQLVYDYEPGLENVMPPCDDGEVYEIFKSVAKTGNILAIHAENSDLMHRLAENIEDKTSNDYDVFLSSRPQLAEVLTVQTAIEFSRDLGTRLHILHVTSKRSVELIRAAQKEGLPITAETCPHYLFLTNESYKEIGPVMKVFPLVKEQQDQDEIWRGIADGTISSVCSDHAPHTEEEKTGNLWTMPAGMCGVETIVPLMLNAVNEGKISMLKFAELLSSNPAKNFDVFPKKGSLMVGTDADITIIDMDKEWTIKREELHSKSKITAYDGFNIVGKPIQTIVRGKTVMKNNEVIKTGVGSLVKRNKSIL